MGARDRRRPHWLASSHRTTSWGEGGAYLLAKCSGITQAGTACKGIPIDGSQWCYVHHPDRTEERRRHGSKGGKRGGRGRPQHETEAIKVLLEDLTERVLSGDLETGPAAVANQLVNTRLRAIEQERKNKETADLETRIEALEAKQPTVQPMKGARRW